MKIEKGERIKSQKNAAILLIIVPMIILISFLFGKADLVKYGIANYTICGGLIVLMICGGVGLKNSLKKQRDLKN
jgi:hypothetical protein